MLSMETTPAPQPAIVYRGYSKNSDGSRDYWAQIHFSPSSQEAKPQK